MFSKKILFVLLFACYSKSNVAENSGTMNLNEYLFSVSSNIIELPIFLSYQAGIKINQHASWVGLGFDLSLPYIDRIPAGSVDEKTGSFFCNGPGYYSRKDYQKLITETSNGYTLSPQAGYFTNQQDIYTLNAPFASGRIVFAEPDYSTFASDYLTDEIIVVSGAWQVGDKVLMEGASLPRPFYDHQNREYFIVEKTGNNIKLSHTVDGSPIDITVNGNGTIVKRNTRLIPYIKNWRPLKIVYRIDGNDDIYRWEITDENGTAYIFGQPVRATTDLTEFAYNTGKTRHGINGWWIMDEEEGVYSREFVTGDHYTNESFNIRWYLTEIRSANYTGTSGDIITISYTPPEETGIHYQDLFYGVSDEYRAVTDIFRYTEGEDDRASFTYTCDNYFFYPVYPDEIRSSSQKAKFYTSPSSDVLLQGKKRIDRIEQYSHNGGNYIIASQLRFDYDANGLSSGHPYSSDGKGRLQLNGVVKLSADGASSFSLYRFGYATNPAWEGNMWYYRHDLFGYYNHAPLLRSGGEYGTLTYPQGQSAVGTVASPGAEAWSVKRIIYGSGRVEEYEYEPNEVTKLTTTETITMKPPCSGLVSE